MGIQAGCNAAGQEQGARRLCGQSSLEALVALSALLCALSILVFSAQGLSGKASGSIQAASERISISYAALLLDTAASSGVQIRAEEDLSGVSLPGEGRVASPLRSSVRETLLHNASTGADGVVYVQKNPAGRA
jgi:hypothetical protein